VFVEASIVEYNLANWFEPVLRLSNDMSGSVLSDRNGQFAEGTVASNSLGDVTRDYVSFLLLMGLRQGDAARFRWAHVDLRARKFTVVDTTNKKPHTLLGVRRSDVSNRRTGFGYRHSRRSGSKDRASVRMEQIAEFVAVKRGSNPLVSWLPDQRSNLGPAD